MRDYIEREAAYPLAKKICDAIDSEDFQRLNFGMRILDWIDDLPAADVRPVVRAAWQSWEQDTPPCKWYSCDYCGFHALSKSNFCPNCGAKMEES